MYKIVYVANGHVIDEIHARSPRAALEIFQRKKVHRSSLSVQKDASDGYFHLRNKKGGMDYIAIPV